ncbi:7-cyano-7-deazaguanine synthase QueC [Priestia aryabhattai]|uniref:7-cyano-7-deazaguanine synthase QueC n=1 Tax=Priestia aryabhattai TaxID=412384 RepID=UPI002E201FD7|nr:7-cyano-7-deazaguanine synthase QueC [Priestia aryabhattai]MED4013275.1 7-cyano-7-deazaguanine synthase QueC [Priestia aryabhattai]
MNKKAVIILSGGLDSSTCLSLALNEGFEVYPLTFTYGQRHDKEVEHANKIINYYEIQNHKIVDISFLGSIGGSALTDKNIEVPTIESKDNIPNTYVPARNMIFLSLASAYAEVIGADAIFTGVSAVDYSGYPDCRPEFIDSMNKTINLATKQGVTGGEIIIRTPLISLTKTETINLGIELGTPYQLTTSCYNGRDKACGKCDSCLLRLRGFKDAGHKDPIEYEESNILI